MKGGRLLVFSKTQILIEAFSCIASCPVLEASRCPHINGKKWYQADGKADQLVGRGRGARLMWLSEECIYLPFLS